MSAEYTRVAEAIAELVEAAQESVRGLDKMSPSPSHVQAVQALAAIGQVHALTAIAVALGVIADAAARQTGIDK